MRNRSDFESGRQGRISHYGRFTAWHQPGPWIATRGFRLCAVSCDKKSVLSYQAYDFRKCRVELLRVAATRLCQVGTPTAGAANHRCDLLDDIAGLDAVRQVRGDRDQQGDLALAK